MNDQPFFSVCIPQHNRTSFLIEVLRSLAVQSFRSFEVCISDDCSTDGREAELVDYLEKSGLPYVYQRQTTNLRYDRNLRASLALARGKYALLLGNDDCLTSTSTLADLAAYIRDIPNLGVVLTNYEDYATRKRSHRVPRTAIIEGGPDRAARLFRDFSFVSGVVLNTTYAHELATTNWDGSEMYQMYIGCRIIARGANLAMVDQSLVRKDIRIEGESVDSYAHRPKKRVTLFKAEHLPLGQVGPLVIDAIAPFTLNSTQRMKLTFLVYLQLYLFTYPFWLVEYRRVQSWPYAFAVALGLRPSQIVTAERTSWLVKPPLMCIYGVVAFVGLVLPIQLFAAVWRPLHRLAKALK